MTKKKRKPVNKNTLTYCKKKLWIVFSRYIRLRDNHTCITCGRKNIGSGMHAGHFIPKVVGGLSLYFDETNVNAQCYRCNLNLGGYGAEYYRQMVAKYGQPKVDQLFYIRDGEQIVFNKKSYEVLTEYYEEKLKEKEVMNVINKWND